MTLFGVGFKVEAKAATPKLDTNALPIIKYYATFDNSEFENSDSFDVGVMTTNNTILGHVSVTLSLENGIKYYEVDGNKKKYNGKTEEWSISRQDFYDGIGTDDFGDCVKVQAYINDNTNVSTPSNVADKINLNIFYQDCYYRGTYEKGDFIYGSDDDFNIPEFTYKGSTYNHGDFIYMLSYDSAKISVNNPVNDKVFRKWRLDEKESETNPSSYTLNGSNSGSAKKLAALFTDMIVVLPESVILYVDTTTTFTPKYSAESVKPTITLSSTDTEYTYKTTGGGKKISLTGVDELSGGTLDVDLSFDGITSPEIDPTDGLIDVDVLAVSPVELGDLCVNLGMKVYLKDYMVYDDETFPIVITDSSGGLVSYNSKNDAIYKIIVEGKKSGYKANGIKADLATEAADVIVYPKPTLSKSTGSSSSNSSSDLKLTVTMPAGVHYATSATSNVRVYDLSEMLLEYKSSSDEGKTRKETISLDSSSSSSSSSSLTKKKEVTKSRKDLTSLFRSICDGDDDTVKVKAYAYHDGDRDTNIVSNEESVKVYKIRLDTSAGASYTVDGESVSDYFYGMDGVTYAIKSSGTGTLDKTNSGEFNSGESISYKVAGARTLKAVYSGSSSSSPSSSSSSSDKNKSAVNGDTNGDDYDDVPKTGESKADIWILWSVLLISILGAGFMIRKRFGLVRAIAAADEEMAKAVHDEKVEAEKKEKESKMQMLKDLRKL